MIMVNGKEFPWEEGLTVQKLLLKMSYTFPLIVVALNSKVIFKEEYPFAIINDGDDIKVIHLVSGG